MLDGPNGPASWQAIDVELASGYAIVRLNRPPVNAVNRQMRVELRTAFEWLSQRRDVNSVVLSAAGKLFCAGVDLKDMAAGTSAPTDQDVHALLDPGWEWRQTQHAMRHCSVPVIAAVDGKAIGAGFGLVGSCDLIVASEQAEFGLTEINVGLLGGASKALRMVGPYKARMMFFGGRLISAQEMYRLGVVERVVENGGAEAAAVELAQDLATKSPIALRMAKESLLRIEGDDVESQYRTEQDYTNRLRGYNDSKEAMSAFIEKRSANWTWS